MKKTHRVIAIVLIVVLAASILYLSDSRKSIFIEKVGDMTLSGYDTGDVAAQQISKMYGIKDIPIAKAYSAVYRSNKGTMRIWVAEASDHNAVNDAFKPLKLDIIEFEKPDVYVMKKIM